MAANSTEETKKNAEKVLSQLKLNKNDTGKLVLDGSFIVRRLVLQERKYPVLFAAVKGMDIDQVSDVIEDSGKFHIVKVIQKEPARDLTMEEAKGFLENKLLFEAQTKRPAPAPAVGQAQGETGGLGGGSGGL